MNPMVITVNPLHTFIILSIIGTLTSYLAKKRGRNPIGWFLIGAFLGLIGLVMLLLLPNKAAQETEPQDEIAPPAPQRQRKPLPQIWYTLADNGTPVGPMSLVALTGKFQEDQIHTQTYVWTESMNDWAQIASLPELLDELSRQRTPIIDSDKEEALQN
jgi:hypothetical protein